jgi:hypothetical protein
MNIHDIRNLANCIYRNSPGGHEPQVRKEAWAEFVLELADEIGRRSRDLDGMVTDHRFAPGIFARVCEGEGSYSLGNPEENDASWDALFDEDSNGDERVYTSSVVLGCDC